MKERIIMLGTGNGSTVKLYNTCFIIQNEAGNFLIDTGSSMEIINRLSQVNIKLEEINNIFISHSHTDHILGLINMFKKIGWKAMHNEYKEKINIYCNSYVHESIINIAKYTLPSKLLDYVYSIVDFKILNDDDKYTINNVEYRFFDLKSKSVNIYGFECVLNDKRLIFLGDVKPEIDTEKDIEQRLTNADYVMHEVFCLDSEEKIFHPYAGNHSTVKSACINMNKLGVKNLILYHTEETHGIERKTLYENEGKQYFKGKVIVPNDLEIIDII